MNYHIDIRLKLSNKGYTFLDFIQGRKHHRVQVHASIRARSFLDTGFWGVLLLRIIISSRSYRPGVNIFEIIYYNL